MFLALPIVVPLGTAIALHLLPQRTRLLRVVAFLGAVLSLAAAVAILVRTLSTGIQVLHVGSWPAPFGITLVADLFSALLVVMAAVVGVAVTGSSFAGVDPRREGLGYHPLIHVLLMGVSGAFLTGDIFNLYVWFEVMLIASFGLIVLAGNPLQLDGAVKYGVLNFVATALFLMALGLLYVVTSAFTLAKCIRDRQEETAIVSDGTDLRCWAVHGRQSAWLFTPTGRTPYGAGQEIVL